MAKVLVTGGSGLIGREVATQLIKAGHEVNIIDFYPVNIENTNHFRGSILDKTSLAKAMEGCDYVVHFAAIMGVANSTENPLECLDVNVQGTRNVLECCILKGIKKIIFSSSSEVYGEPTKVPISEDDQRQPKSEYGVSKVMGEEYVKAFGKEYGLNYSMVRFFNIFGPDQTNNFVMSVFINKALNSQPLIVYGDGSQVRAFCYVEDAARGALEVLFNEKANGHVFNIGNNNNEISMLELAKLILKLANKQEEPQLIPLENSDRTKEREIFKRIPDTSKAKQLLNFEARIDLEEGIKRVLEQKQILERETQQAQQPIPL